jgi:hypothetical protein
MYHTIQTVRTKNYWQTSEEMIRSIRRRNNSVGVVLEAEEKYTHVKNALGIRVRIASDNSVGIVTGWMARVRFPAGKDFSLLHIIQTGSETHPACYPLGIGGKAAGA